MVLTDKSRLPTTSRLNSTIRSITRVCYHQITIDSEDDVSENLSKPHLPPITALFRITLTRMIRTVSSLIMTWLRGSKHRPIANMATISPNRGFSVATVARGWLLVFTCGVAGKTAVSQASFPLNSTKNKSIFFAEKIFNLVCTLWILFFYTKLTINWRTAITDRVICSDRDNFDCLIFFIHCI